MVRVKLSSTFCKSNCDFHIQFQDNITSLGLGLLYYDPAHSCSDKFPSSEDEHSISIQSLRTTTLCIPLAPYQKTVALNSSTDGSSKYKVVDGLGGTSKCFSYVNQSKYFQTTVSEYEVYGIYLPHVSNSLRNMTTPF